MYYTECLLADGVVVVRYMAVNCRVAMSASIWGTLLVTLNCFYTTGTWTLPAGAAIRCDELQSVPRLFIHLSVTLSARLSRRTIRHRFVSFNPPGLPLAY